jgi:uncharacterized membrane protein YoaT (DUF817 family)
MNIKRIVAYGVYYVACVVSIYAFLNFLSNHYAIDTYKITITIDLIHLLLAIIFAGPIKYILDCIKNSINTNFKK